MDQIDDKNRQDPNQEMCAGIMYPKELLYSIRMSECLHDFEPLASEALQLAARAQHICRWEIPRSEFPMDRQGYLRWRNKLKSLHAELAREIMQQAGYEEDLISEVSDLIQKKNLKQSSDTQTLEDVICHVFLKYYLPEFSQKKSEEKIVEILRKTWRKMSLKGQEEALKLDLPEETIRLVKEAVKPPGL